MTRLFVFLFFAGACTPAKAPATSVPAAKLERTTLEGLVSITLREDAQAALGLELGAVEKGLKPAQLIVGGEVMVPAGRELVLSAPVGGRIAGALPQPGALLKAGQVLMTLVPLATVDRDVRARAQRDLEVARADAQLSETRLKRAESMMNDRSGSVRAFEDARAQQQIAQASVVSAESRLQTLSSGALDADVSFAVKSPADGVLRAVRVGVGQSVPAGAPLVEIASSGRWVRTALSSGDAVRTSKSAHVWAERLGSGERVELAALQGPPSADVVRGTVDVFHALPSSADWSPGERVLVQLETDGLEERLSVPFSSVVRDAEGGAWVFVQQAPHQFRRHRVDVLRRDGERLVLARGPAAGAQVVSVGAVELWGFELGADR
jgi:membrane fusion protein, heavy metal efflux system